MLGKMFTCNGEFGISKQSALVLQATSHLVQTYPIFGLGSNKFNNKMNNGLNIKNRSAQEGQDVENNWAMADNLLLDYFIQDLNEV